MPHSKSITSDYRDFKSKNIIGVVTNTECSGIGEGGGGAMTMVEEEL